MANRIVVAYLTKFKIIITNAKQKFGSSYKGVTIVYKNLEDSKSSLREATSDVDVILADPSISVEDFKSISDNVKWVQFTWAGLDSLTKQFNTEELQTFKPPFIVTRLAEGYAKGMADYVVAQVISMERNFKLIYEKQWKNEWMARNDVTHEYRMFSDLTVGVLGAGNIGVEIAKYLKLMGAKVTGVKRNLPSEKHEYIDHFYSIDQLDEFLASCDYFCNVLPHTPQTIGLLSGDKLKNCSKKKAGFINIGRGSIIDESSLVTALKNQWIRGAVLDVFEKEPLPSSSPLWNLPNCTITPHISGSCLNHATENVFIKNFMRFVDNQPLLYQYDWERLY